MHHGSALSPTLRGDLSCVAVELSRRAFSEYAATLGLAPPEALNALVRALTLSLIIPADNATSPLTLVVRGGDAPVLAWIGLLDPPLRAHIETQARALEFTCSHLRYLGYPEAEEACRRLAARLVSRFGREELARADFAAIPNGGFVVLGLLASILGLSRNQLNPLGNDSSLLVIVDDCAISGSRFREFLGSCQSRHIAFAPLVSPPALRAAIQATEGRVVDCLSGEDLREIPGPISEEHQARRQARLARGDCYWLGSTEPLCFPWNEPDRTLWNPAAERSERAWRIVPPELCLKNRGAISGPPIPVQVQQESRGPLRPAPQVLFAEIDGDVVVCSLQDDQVFRLGSTGSVLWRGLMAGGNLEAAIDAVAGEFDAPREIVRTDAQRFVEDLLTRGLLVDSGR